MSEHTRPLLDLHPSLWTGRHCARPGAGTVSSGHTQLDAELPGRGWPLGAMTEILTSRPGSCELSLLIPALRRLDPAKLLLLIAPPHTPCIQAWQDASQPVPRLVWVSAAHPADRVWACAQALKHQNCAAILAWLPATLPQGALRQLHLLAAAGDTLLICLRPADGHLQPSPASLRLLLEPSLDQGATRLDVRLLKRRGPPCAAAIRIPLRPQFPQPSHPPLPHAPLVMPVATHVSQA